MRNYELVRAIYDELRNGDGSGGFANPYLNQVITITKMIEEERPEMMDDDPHEGDRGEAHAARQN